MDFREVELETGLCSTRAREEYPPRNITLVGAYEARITVFGYDKRSRRIELGFSKMYRRLIEALLGEGRPTTLGCTSSRGTLGAARCTRGAGCRWRYR